MTIAPEDFIPMFIKQILGDNPRKVITSDRWNELWNLAITQGDHSSEALQGLVTAFLAYKQYIDNNLYTKVELDPYLTGGDTDIVYEVFTVLTANNGDGTFTYQNADGLQRAGTITAEGYQLFNLEKGNFVIGSNRIKAIINDTLQRSVASGGLVEVSGTQIALTTPVAAGTEVTFEYFFRIDLAMEYTVVRSPEAPITGYGNAIWFKPV